LAVPHGSVAADPRARATPAAPHVDSIITDGGLDHTFNAGKFTNGWVYTAVLQPMASC
jgi:hypothetical protein